MLGERQGAEDVGGEALLSVLLLGGLLPEGRSELEDPALGPGGEEAEEVGRGELLALRWSDVDLFKGEITVRHSMYRRKMKCPKAKKVVTIPMTPKLKEVLLAAYHTSHLPTDHVLPGPDGHRDMAPQTLVDIVKAAYRAAGVPYKGLQYPPARTRGGEGQGSGSSPHPRAGQARSC